jgi:hypothetical protein
MVNLPSDEDIQKLKDQKDWVKEIKTISSLIEKVEEMGKNSSIRSLSQVTKKSKSWVAVSLMLLKGLKTYPEIERFDTRNEAFVYLQRKNKQRGTLQK